MRDEREGGGNVYRSLHLQANWLLSHYWMLNDNVVTSESVHYI